MNKQYIGWLLKGAAMGAADAVPGVSGGTIALITGVYERFIGALASFRPSLFGFVVRKDFIGLWRAVDGEFLLSLGMGIAISIFSVLNLMHWLLLVAEPLVWAFFMGVIVASIYSLGVGRVWHASDLALTLLGLFVSLTLIVGGNYLILSGYALESTPMVLVFGGALAISAMLLPGISGSFMLLILGLYPVIVDAVHDRNLMVVFWVAVGCLIGILSFSRVLQWALQRWHQKVITFMLGFVIGALIKVWPWQADGVWYSPASYMATTGRPSMLFTAVVVGLAGAIVVFVMHKLTDE